MVHTLVAMVNKSKQYKTLERWSRDMLNFDLLEKGLRLASPPHVVCDFLRKNYVVFY